jgi:hypothetical protein
MNLFIVGLGHIRPEQIDTVRGLAKNHKISYWVRMEHVFKIDKSEFPNTTFHDYRSALDGKPAFGLDDSNFEPLDQELLIKFSETEAEILTMMEKKFESWGVNQRRDFYFDLMRYWKGVFDQFKPDAVIFSDVPHEVYSFVIYALAKYLGVKTVMFENIFDYGRLMLFNDYKFGNKILAKESENGFSKNYHLGDLSEYTRKYYEKQISGKDEIPVYVDVYNKEHSGLRKFVRISKATWPFVKDGSIFERATKYFFKLFKSNVIKEYKKFETIPDFNKKFIYIALHFQPERTTSPQGGYFVDQLLMIKTLSSALPKDWLLYVKEHPSQWKPHSSNYTGYRYPGYYAEIAKLKNAKIIPVTTDNYKLIKNSEVVSTITGIPGWEAVLRGKPAFIFGYSWFMHAPGVFRVRGVRDCREAIKKIENGYKVDKQKMLNYIALLDRVSFEGFNDNYGRQVSKIKDEENAMNILEAIEEELKTV